VKKGAMMVKMGSCKGVNMKSSINDKWRLGDINRLMVFPSEKTWPTQILKRSEEKKLKRLCLEGNEWDDVIFQGN